MDIAIKVRPKLIAAFLLLIVGILSVLNALTLVSEYAFGRDHVKGLVPMFRMNAEGNIPTFFSSLHLLIASVLFAAIGWQYKNQNDPSSWRWTLLAVIAFAMVCDEAGQIHEMLDTNREWTEGVFKAEGALVGPWVVVYAAIVFLFVAVFLPFFLRLKRRYQILFGGAGVMFVVAAIGFEMIGAAEWWEAGESFNFELINSIEEMIEMTAIVVVIYGLISYMQDNFGWRQLRLSDDRV